jgi:hypothetical protein
MQKHGSTRKARGMAGLSNAVDGGGTNDAELVAVVPTR